MKLQPIQVHEIEGLTPEQTAQHKSLAADTAEHNRQCAANAEGVQSLGAVAWDQHATKEAANLAHEKSALRADNLRLRKSLDDFFDDIAPARGALLTKAFAHHEQTQADLRQVMSKLGFVFPPEGEGAPVLAAVATHPAVRAAQAEVERLSNDPLRDWRLENHAEILRLEKSMEESRQRALSAITN